MKVSTTHLKYEERQQRIDRDFIMRQADAISTLVSFTPLCGVREEAIKCLLIAGDAYGWKPKYMIDTQ